MNPTILRLPARRNPDTIPRAFLIVILLCFATPVFAQVPADPRQIEILAHSWHPTEVWDRIGKTRFSWMAKVQNHTERRQRVFVYYDLLSGDGAPLARNVMNQVVEPGSVVDIKGDSYIESPLLPLVKGSRASAKVSPYP